MSPLSTGTAFLTVVEAAQHCRCSPCTIRRAIASKRIAVHKPSGKRGRTLISTQDLISYMQRSRIAAVGEER